jgi:hypothetical protein
LATLSFITKGEYAMTLNNHETGSNSSSPFVYLQGGAGMGQMWLPHIAQLSNFHSPVFESFRQGRTGKNAAEVLVNKIKEWLTIHPRAEPRKMEQCCNAACLATA